MIVQHPMLWCAAMLMAGIVVGMWFPLPCWLPLLAAAVIACTLLKQGHWHDLLTLAVWFLLGCCRISYASPYYHQSQWQQSVERKAKGVQTMLIARLGQSGVSPQTLALAQALTLGKRDDLPSGMRRAYNRVGASHLLALSGLHLGIIYGILYFIFIRWIRHSKLRWMALPPILLCLWGYVVVAGMPVSLLRAALMLSLLTMLSLMQYATDPLHPLSLSAIIILLISPTELWSISFQLSFVSVFFLVALWTPLREMLPRLNWAVQLVAVSCVASLGTLPLVAYYFHQVALLGPLLSLVLIPLTTLIIYLSLAAMICPVAPIGWLLDKAVMLQQHVIDAAGSLPFATLERVHPPLLQVVLIYAALLIAIVRLRTAPSME